MWGADKESPLLWVSPCSAQRTNAHPPSPGLVSTPPSLGSWHSCPDPCQILGRRQMGSGSLCTNQGGICSLTDTSPLTHVSSHIHYSSSARWAAVKGSEQSGGWAGEWEADGGVGGRWWAIQLAALSAFNVSEFFIWRRWTSYNIWSGSQWSLLCFNWVSSNTSYILCSLSFRVTVVDNPSRSSSEWLDQCGSAILEGPSEDLLNNDWILC